MAKKNSKRNLIIFLILLVVLVGIAAAVMMNMKQEAVEVETAKVTKRNITKIVSAVGKLQPETEVKVFSETSGELILLDAKEGDYVSEGKVLARIKPDIIQSQLEGAEAGVKASENDIDVAKSAMEKARTEFERIEKLYQKKFVSQQDFISARTAYEQSKSNIESSKARLAQNKANAKQIQFSAVRTTVYAPMNGTVTKLGVKKGEKVLGQAQFQGTELMRVSDLNVMNAEVDVDENDIVNVKIGDTASVEVDALPDQEFKGVVIEIGNSAKSSEVASQDQVINFKVKIRIIDNSNKFRPGMSCNVKIITETRQNVLAVPLMAVTSRIDTSLKVQDVDNGEMEETKKNKTKEKPKTYVFVKTGDKVKMKHVEIGLNSQDYIEIKSGLSENEEIISGPYSVVNKTLKDDMKIKLEDKKKKETKK